MAMPQSHAHSHSHSAAPQSRTEGHSAHSLPSRTLQDALETLGELEVATGWVRAPDEEGSGGTTSHIEPENIQAHINPEDSAAQDALVQKVLDVTGVESNKTKRTRAKKLILQLQEKAQTAGAKAQAAAAHGHTDAAQEEVLSQINENVKKVVREISETIPTISKNE